MIMDSNGLTFGIELNKTRRLKMPTEVKEKPKKVATPKWSMNQDDYIKLLESIDTNAKAINTLSTDIKRIKIRMGL